MLTVTYTKVLAYPFSVILSQYFDYEHVQFVHPDTLGEMHLVETRGNVIIYEQLWPRRFGLRRRSRVRQEFFPPNEIHFEFVAGLHKGIQVHTWLHEHPEGTKVVETYTMPRLPNWGWLRAWVSRSVVRQVDRIWEEDLQVKVCHGGWPGIPRQV